MSVLDLLQLVKQVPERSENESMAIIVWIRFPRELYKLRLMFGSLQSYFFVSHQFRGSGEGVGFSRGGLSVAESSATETLDCHLNQPLDPRVLEHIFLRGSWLEDHVVGEEFRFLIGTRSLALCGIGCHGVKWSVNYNDRLT